MKQVYGVYSGKFRWYRVVGQNDLYFRATGIIFYLPDSINIILMIVAMYSKRSVFMPTKRLRDFINAKSFICNFQKQLTFTFFFIVRIYLLIFQFCISNVYLQTHKLSSKYYDLRIT